MGVRPIPYRCPECGREVESWYDDSWETIPNEIPCTCGRDVWMKKFNVKNNLQRERIFDRKVHVPE